MKFRRFGRLYRVAFKECLKRYATLIVIDENGHLKLQRVSPRESCSVWIAKKRHQQQAPIAKDVWEVNLRGYNNKN